MPSRKMYQPTSPFSQPMKQFSQSREITEARTRGRVTVCKTTARASCSAGHKHLVTEKKVQQLSAIERQNTRQHGRASNRFAVNGGGWPTRQLPPAGAVSRPVHASNPSSQSPRLVVRSILFFRMEKQSRHRTCFPLSIHPDVVAVSAAANDVALSTV